jgi:hypothetical protein
VRRVCSASEADPVSVGIEHYKRGGSPGFFPQRLSKLDFGGSIFREQAIDVVDIEKRSQKSLPFAYPGMDDGFVDEAEMQPGGVAAHRSAGRRIAVQEIDRKAELIAKECRGGLHT